MLHQGSCLDVLKQIPEASVDLIFADPPYFLSNGGISCQAGKMVSVNKAEWDKSQGFESDVAFTEQWILACRRVLAPNGSIWISGTQHNIHIVGFLLQKHGFKILNDIVWFKPNAPPNLACRYFAHSHEMVIWARQTEKSKHLFNYESMKQREDRLSPAGKQMKSVWSINLTPPSEKAAGRHPTQKPEELLRRIILATTIKGQTVLDPFNGSGTTGVVAKKLGRKYIGIDMEPAYLNLTIKRLKLTRTDL